MGAAVCAFSEDASPAHRLALALAVPFIEVDEHLLPDGESRPSVAETAPTVLLYRDLSQPDRKLMPLLLAADALRRRGARRLVLVAPYMPYLRQDRVFEAGQPLSRDVWGKLLGQRFERIITVQAHLHRTRSLREVFGRAEADNLSAVELFAGLDWPEGTVVAAPDQEAQPWAADLAAKLGADEARLCKVRVDDREVRLTLPPNIRIAGRPVVLLDDIISSGSTVVAAAMALTEAGAASIDVAVVHALFDEAAAARMTAAGVRRILSTDSVSHPTNRVHLAGVLAKALAKELAK